MFPVKCEGLRTDHLIPLLIVTMPYACWFLWPVGKVYWGLQVTSSFSIWGCILKGCFERCIFWRAKSCLKGIEDFNLEHCILSSHSKKREANTKQTLVYKRISWRVDCAARTKSVFLVLITSRTFFRTSSYVPFKQGPYNLQRQLLHVPNWWYTWLKCTFRVIKNIDNVQMISPPWRLRGRLGSRWALFLDFPLGCVASPEVLVCWFSYCNWIYKLCQNKEEEDITFME